MTYDVENLFNLYCISSFSTIWLAHELESVDTPCFRLDFERGTLVFDNVGNVMKNGRVGFVNAAVCLKCRRSTQSCIGCYSDKVFCPSVNNTTFLKALLVSPDKRLCAPLQIATDYNSPPVRTRFRLSALSQNNLLFLYGLIGLQTNEQQHLELMKCEGEAL